MNLYSDLCLGRIHKRSALGINYLIIVIMVIIHQMNYLEHMPQDVRYQTIEGASLCVPDMSLTLTEIVKRFASGQLVAAAHNVTYDEHASIDDSNETERPDFDISDAQKISDGIKQRLDMEAAAKAVKERSDAEAAKAAEIKQAVDAALAELQAKTGTPVSE